MLSAVTPDGLPCAAPGSPPIEVDLDTQASTLTATAGEAGTTGFQLWPQVLQGSLPVAVRTEGAQRFAAVQDLARIVGTLQQAASFPLDVQLVPADAFIADDRSGVIVGATTADATSLEAPLKLSSIRLLDQADSSFEVTSQEPYAVLEAIDVDARQVLMLGGWSPGNQAAPRALTDKLLDYLVSTGWPPLDGDLLLTDDSAPPFTVDSTTLTQEETTEAETEERSYAKWFVAGVALLLLLLAFQVRHLDPPRPQGRASPRTTRRRSRSRPARRTSRTSSSASRTCPRTRRPRRTSPPRSRRPRNRRPRRPRRSRRSRRK